VVRKLIRRDDIKKELDFRALLRPVSYKTNLQVVQFRNFRDYDLVDIADASDSIYLSQFLMPCGRVIGCAQHGMMFCSYLIGLLMSSVRCVF